MPAESTRYKTTLSYNELITANNITVKYDEFLFSVVKDGDGGYGNSSLTYNALSLGLPFYIINENGQNAVYTSTGGQHTIEISVDESSVKTTKCFKKAVRSISGGIILNYNYDAIEGATWQEAYDMLVNGAMVYLKDRGDLYPCIFYGSTEIGFGKTDVVDNGVVMYIYIWNSDGTVTFDSVTYPSE